MAARWAPLPASFASRLYQHDVVELLRRRFHESVCDRAATSPRVASSPVTTTAHKYVFIMPPAVSGPKWSSTSTSLRFPYLHLIIREPRAPFLGLHVLDQVGGLVRIHFLFNDVGRFRRIEDFSSTCVCERSSSSAMASAAVSSSIASTIDCRSSERQLFP